MREFANLVLNESEKIYRKKRIFVVMLILAILIPLFVYAQYREIETTQKARYNGLEGFAAATNC